MMFKKPKESWIGRKFIGDYRFTTGQIATVTSEPYRPYFAGHKVVNVTYGNGEKGLLELEELTNSVYWKPYEDTTFHENKNFVPRYEVVYTSGFADVGLLIETDSESNPKRVRARYYSEGNPKAEYGGVDITHWMHSGVFLTEEQWDNITYKKPTQQIVRALNLLIPEEGCNKTNKTEKDQNEELEEERE